jgi:hypothetical protein
VSQFFQPTLRAVSLPNFNLSLRLGTANDGPAEAGNSKMSALQDRDMERLSDLLTQGQLSSAQEIATLLKIERGTPTTSISELSQRPACYPDDGPAERCDPANGCDGDCAQIANLEKPL